MVVAIIFIICFLIIFIKAYINSNFEPRESVVVSFMCGLIIAIIITFMLYIEIEKEYKQPSAIDVYRGNTDLDITYTIKNNDTISVDTLIIFKDK